MIKFSSNKKYFPVIFLECLQDGLSAAPASCFYFTSRKERILSNESKCLLATLKAHTLNIPGYSSAIANSPDMTHVVEQCFLTQNSFIRELLVCS